MTTDHPQSGEQNMKPRKTYAEPNLQSLEPRIPSALKKRNTAKTENRRRRKMAAILTPLLAALQERTAK
jgi:hypothetical protein